MNYQHMQSFANKGKFKILIHTPMQNSKCKFIRSMCNFLPADICTICTRCNKNFGKNLACTYRAYLGLKFQTHTHTRVPNSEPVHIFVPMASYLYPCPNPRFRFVPYQYLYPYTNGTIPVPVYPYLYPSSQPTQQVSAF